MKGVFELARVIWRRYIRTGKDILVLAVSALVIHRIIFSAWLKTTNDNVTLIHLDLLQAVAFLVALSALLITVTWWVVNKARDNELLAREASWKAQNIEDLLQLHAQNHPDYTDDVRRLEEQITELVDRFDGSEKSLEKLTAENDRLVSENEHLQKQVDELTRI